MAQTSPDLASSGTLHEIEPIERETIRRVTWRLMPLLMLGYFCAYLDRSNVGMAATTMVQYLGFTNAVLSEGILRSIATGLSNGVLEAIRQRRRD